MTKNKIERKIAVIFVADIVGYSKHIEKDENATLHSMRECNNIIKNLLKGYKGRIFNTGGDSVLAEFQSATEAVEFSYEFQKKIILRNKTDKNFVKLQYRIGLNMGDVINEKGNLLGDGVNIAARLEALAQPNGISISKSVYELVNKKLKLNFNDLGIQKVKQNSFHAYDIIIDPSQKKRIKSQSFLSIPMMAGILTAVVIIFVSIFYFNINNQTIEKIEENLIESDSSPTILINPFKSYGKEDQSIPIAMTESLITSLSQYRGINVLSSSTSLFVKENNLSDDQIAREFRANFIINGSVQSFGKNNRLILELIDLSKKQVVWSDKIDFELDGIFKLQDEVGFKLLEELQVNAVVGQQAATWFEEFGFNTFEQYNLFLNIRRESRKGTPDGLKNREILIRELKLSNVNQNILDYLDGWFIYFGIFFKQANNIEVKNDIEKLDQISKRLLINMANNEAYALRAMSEIHFFSKECSKAIENIEKALILKSSVDIYTIAGGIYFLCNDLEKTLVYQRKALMLMPNDNGYFLTKQYLATLYMLDKKQEVINLFENKIDTVKEARIPAIYAAIEMERGNKKISTKLYKKALEYGFIKKIEKLWNKEFYNKINPTWERIEELL